MDNYTAGLVGDGLVDQNPALGTSASKEIKHVDELWEPVRARDHLLHNRGVGPEISSSN
jgi:hypothetical protein